MAAIAARNAASEQYPDGFETNNDGSLRDSMVHSVNACIRTDEGLMRRISDWKSTTSEKIQRRTRAHNTNKNTQPSHNNLHFPFPRTRVVPKKTKTSKKIMGEQGLQSPRSGKPCTCQYHANYLSTTSCPPNRGAYFIERSESLKKIRFHC